MVDVQLSQTTADLVGRRLGNYRLIEQLGSGGFATVYLGRHRYLGTLAAVKVLHSRPVGQKLEQFKGEAQIAGRLIHPHIIRVLEFGLHGRIPYLVMDFAPNYTLRDRHPPGQRLSPARVVLYVQQVASALQYIHDNGLIHRDVKPGNMLIGEDQGILLSDFGISIAAHRSRAASRQKIVGTVAYMAPEQIQGESYVASDQYALGVVVYEWLTGRLPFEGSQDAIVDGHLYYAPPPLRSIVPALSPVVERVVLKVLAKTPEERFGSVQEFAQALERASQPSTQPGRPRVKRPKRRKHLEAAGLLAACCAIGTVLGIILRILGFELEGFWLLFVLLLVGFPLVVSLSLCNYVAFRFACGVVALSALLGFAFHSASVFLVIYAIFSFFNMIVAFNRGIQDERPRKRP